MVMACTIWLEKRKRMDVYRVTTNEVVDEYNSFRGNVYQSDSVYAESILDKLPKMDLRDSMRNVLIKEKNLQQQVVTSEL